MLEATLRLRSPETTRANFASHEKIVHLGDYRIVREIGRGGMGVVYEAEQVSLRRRVALKILAGPYGWDAQARERFGREARSAAGLHHTNIVPIFEVGEEGGVCFYAMQYIVGIALDELFVHLTGKRQPPRSSDDRFEVPPELASASHPGYFRAVARLGFQVAGGLAYAHARGIIHRDIKPGNLLLDAAGVVWITDFGLAKHADDSLTRPGDILGTLGFMAPERFKGGGDGRADVYALGVTLYELATRRRAFPEVTEPSHVERLAIEPPRPTLLDPAIPRDLETIVLKAMDKDPERRYQTADELADDLRRFLDDEPIRARPIGALARVVRWTRRRPLLATLIGAVLLLSATVVVGAVAAAIAFRNQAKNEAIMAAQQRALMVKDVEQAKAALDANAAAQEIAVLMLGILDEADPLALSGRVFGGRGAGRNEHLSAHVLNEAFAKLEASPAIGPEFRATLMNKFGAVFASLGDYERAKKTLQTALVLRRERFGDSSLEVAESLHCIGLAHLTQKSLDDAEDAYRKALTIRERELGPDHPLATATLTHLAIVSAFDDRSRDSEALLRRALANLRAHAGAESREYGLTATYLSVILLNDGKIDEAAALLPEAIRLIERHEGSNGLGQATKLFLQGRLASKVGLQDVATKQYVEALRLVEETLGESHFLAVMGRNELASHYHSGVKNPKAAEAEYRKVQQAFVKLGGPRSASAAVAKMHQARALRDLGRLADAEPLLRDASEVMRLRNRDSLGRCLHILWEVCRKQGRQEEALPILREAVQERKKSSDLVWYVNAASDLAIELQETGRTDEAAQPYREAAVRFAQIKAPSLEARLNLAGRAAQFCGTFKDAAAEKARDAIARTGIDALREAIDAKQLTWREIENRRELDALRGHPAFRELAAAPK